VEAVADLQSIIIGPNGRAAMIDGKVVGPGATVNDAKVVEVRTDSVVMVSERGTETLRLFPAVEKRAPAQSQDHVSRTDDRNKTVTNRRGSK
jgi:hypothetical protein